MAIDNIANPVAAANAYTNSAKTAAIDGVDAEGFSFSDLIKNSARSVIDNIRGGEKVQAQAVSGKADLADVVDATNSAELTLQMVVAIRDRMVSAYQDIMRMTI